MFIKLYPGHLMKKNFIDQAFPLYPNQPFLFHHSIKDTALLTLDEIAKAADEMPIDLLEYTTTTFHPQSLSHGDLVRSVTTSKTWLFLRNLEFIPRYKVFMESLLQNLVNDYHLDEFGRLLKPMSFIFISSPNSITPFHIDPEHNFLFQVSGNKKCMVNNSFVKSIISEKEIQDFYADEVGFSLAFNPDYLMYLDTFNLIPGKGVYIPVTSPHVVFTGDEVSISYSLTFRTLMSEHHRKVYLANRALRLRRNSS
jgi:hypothetical protein